jgi:hypothetical protein
MPEAACITCRNRWRCPDEGDLQRETFFAMGKGKSVPECRDYVPLYSRGVEGVLERAVRRTVSHH